MSDGVEELAKRLEESKGTFATTLRRWDIEQAAALLRQQSATIERLREALKRLEPWDNLGIARAALEQSS